MTTTVQPPEPAQPSGSSPTPALGPAGLAVARYVSPLQRRFRADNPAAVADLARLRRGAGHTAHDAPDHWGLGGLEELAEILTADSTGARHQEAEQAVYLAVTLWALHQQSVHDDDMHAPRRSLGGAVRELMRRKHDPKDDADPQQTPASSARRGQTTTSRADEELNEPLRKRLVRVGTAHSIESVAVRLREIVLLLRAGRVPLDYARLADQLYRWQLPAQRAAVRREWGRAFHLAARQGRETGGASPNGQGSAQVDDPIAGLDEEYEGDDDYGSGE